MLSQILINSPHLSEICFYKLSVNGLQMIASSQCVRSIRIIKASITDNENNGGVATVEAIKTFCRACPNLLSLGLNISTYLRGELEVDFIRCVRVIRCVIQSCPLIEVFPIQNLTEEVMNILSTIHTLKEFKLGACTVSTALVQRVFGANQFTKLTLRHPIKSALVSSIGKYCGNLRVLLIDISFRPAISDECLRDLFQGCSLLEVIKMENACTLSNTTLQVLFHSCHYITDITLFYGFQPSPEYDNNSDVEPVIEAYYPTLVNLSVSGEMMSDSALRDIFTHCTNLKEVKIESSGDSTNIALDALATYCLLLEVCELEYDKGIVSNRFLRDLFRCCRRLTELVIDLRGGVQGPVCYGLFTNVLSACYPALTKLTVQGEGVYDTAMRDMFTYCTSLRHLEVGNYPTCLITDTSIERLVENCPLLETLTLEYCEHFTVESMVDIAMHCTNLTSLTLHTTPINKHFLIQLSLHCPKLDYLCITSCKGKFTENEIILIADKCTQLTFFRVSHCAIKKTDRLIKMDKGELYTHMRFQFHEK